MKSARFLPAILPGYTISPMSEKVIFSFDFMESLNRMFVLITDGGGICRLC